MKKSTLFMGALLGLTLTTTGTLAVVANFTDVPSDHWAAKAITNLKDMGVVKGYTDNTFRPNASVTRAEVAVMLDNNNTLWNNKVSDLTNDLKDMQAQIDKLASDMVKEITYMADMKGASEVPAVVTTAHGTANFTLKDHKLTYSVEVMDLSGPVTGSHIHMGKVGENGAVVHSITFEGTKAIGSWTLTDEELKNLEAGMYYLNVHTDANPNGEIRGQVLPTQA